VYQWLYQADMVIADLSTMNANVFYELGVRHAQKPNTTLVIAEKEMMGRIPFDLSHTVIHAYEHLGEEIAEAEAARFVDHLATTVAHLLENPVDRDSPVYTHLRGMKPPEYVDFESAAGLFWAALEQSPGDVFLRQRLALVTHKRREKDGDAAHLDRAVAFYVKHDYHNGTNVAFLHTLRALRAESDFDAIVFYGHGNLVRRRVADVCRRLMEAPGFEARGDREWVV
jgi:plasmid stabilization system protein ParE